MIKKKQILKIFPVFSIYRFYFEKKLYDFSCKIKKKQKILDFASAGNKYSFLFKNHFYDGGDIIDYKNKKIFKNHNFYIDDLTVNKFKRNYYDILISTHSLEHIKNYKNIEIAINKLKRNLKKGGIFVTVFHQNNKYSNFARNKIFKDFKLVKIQNYNGLLSQFSYIFYRFIIEKKIPKILKYILYCLYSLLNRAIILVINNFGDLYLNNAYNEFYVGKKK